MPARWWHILQRDEIRYYAKTFRLCLTVKHSIQHMYYFVGLQCFSSQCPISVTFHHTVAVAGHFDTSAKMSRPKGRSVHTYRPNYLSTRTEISWCQSVRTLRHQYRTVLLVPKCLRSELSWVWCVRKLDLIHDCWGKGHYTCASSFSLLLLLWRLCIVILHLPVSCPCSLPSFSCSRVIFLY